ncbi:hypothetical protein CONLIGDRAFT_440749 [Coniochaeta ligniaria NRRL 30616]|uniref:Uncharacterized protein n=1 Tax=Coniochaeta ligniaria NRRL 30616 TaxID=1408157 RepID=A0A1J7JIX9_9PEZI|nr:hypothetical protein CONLIGDRAFT_440749 [Coniochaeta ligniaria NRRL 30616]
MPLTKPVLVDVLRAEEDAAEAWLERALDRAEPVRAELIVVDPVVVRKVDESLVTVETSSEVETAEEGTVVAPPIPLRPDSVVVPVTVKVEPLVVRVAVKVDVPTADEEPAPKIVVDPVVEVTVEPPLVMTVTRPEVVMAEEVTEPP